MATPVIQKAKDFSFFSTNNTVALIVGTVSANAVLVGTGSWLQARFTNVGSNVVYIALGTDNTVAAVAPVSGTPANGIPILPNSTVILSIGTTTFVAAIAAVAGNTLFITVGNGGL